MALNRTTLYAYLRKAPFGGRLTQEQVDGVEAILNAWSNAPRARDLRCLAYIFATAFHETGGRLAPVREGFAKTDASARKIVATRKYGKPDPVTGHVYYGRGLVQLTWAENYKKMGRKLSYGLYENPDAALEMHLSAEILVRGMIDGDYTGKKLYDYFNEDGADPKGARRIINGTDKADLIAGYYKSFLGALEAADTKTDQPQDVKPADAKVDTANLPKDKTTWGAIVAAFGTGGVGFLTSIDNPWALGAFALVVAVGVLLFLTGRFEISRKAGV